MYESKAKHDCGRGWAINRIVERLPVRVPEARIVLLAGEDLDRQWLIRRGFANHNIISVDRDDAAVDLVRRNGGIAIHGSIQDVLRCWPDDWKVNGLLLDFNCGLDEPVVVTLSALLSKPFRSASCYLNLQRGRDWAGRIFSKELAVQPSLNRAHHALSAWVNAQVIGAPDANRFSEYERRYFASLYWSDLCAVPATSYRQKKGGVLMDGCVFTVPDDGSWGESIKSTDTSTTLKVIAARAVSTRFRKRAA